jgi:hypothetical protein
VLSNLRAGTGFKTFLKRHMRKARARSTPITRVDIAEQAEGCVITFGPNRLTIAARGMPESLRATPDYALFVLAAISMSRGWNFLYEGPVSRSAGAQLRRLALIWRSLGDGELYPLRLALPNLVTGEGPVGAGRILSLSAGIDSTFAALRHKDELTHAMYADGDGYVTGDSRRFAESRRRVDRICELLDLKPVVVETNARDFFESWTLLHTSMLATCLHFAGRGLAGGAIAADLVPYQELIVLPWGNMTGLVECFSTDSFSMAHLGAQTTRIEKILYLAENLPELFEHMTVCNNPAGDGGNCGRCGKCQRTRFSFQTIPDPCLRTLCERRMFPGTFDSLDYVRRFSTPVDEKGRSITFERFDLVRRYLPEGPLAREIDILLDRVAHSLA